MPTSTMRSRFEAFSARLGPPEAARARASAVAEDEANDADDDDDDEADEENFGVPEWALIPAAVPSVGQRRSVRGVTLRQTRPWALMNARHCTACTARVPNDRYSPSFTMLVLSADWVAEMEAPFPRLLVEEVLLLLLMTPLVLPLPLLLAPFPITARSSAKWSRKCLPAAARSIAAGSKMTHSHSEQRPLLGGSADADTRDKEDETECESLEAAD